MSEAERLGDLILSEEWHRLDAARKKAEVEAARQRASDAKRLKAIDKLAERVRYLTRLRSDPKQFELIRQAIEELQEVAK